MRKQVTHSHAVGAGDLIEALSQLIGDGRQLSASLAHACQQSAPVRHGRSLIDDQARSNGWMAPRATVRVRLYPAAILASQES